MLKFFRTIRKKLIEQDNVRKYLLYAIGEILLVVIGILIALQVNNWNEKRVQNNKEYDYLQEIRENLVADTVQINQVFEFNSAKTDTVTNLTEVLISETDPVKITGYIQSNMFILVEFEIFSPTNVAFSNMVNAESISIIRNRELREALSLHYSDDDIYRGTQERVRQLTRNFTDRIIPYLQNKESIKERFGADTNYPGASSMNVGSDPQIFGDIQAMDAIMRSQNSLLTATKNNIKEIIGRIDTYLENF